MTTTTRKTAKPAKGDIRSETLEQFDNDLTEYFGQPTGFGELVTGLYAARQAIAQLDKARKAVFEHVKAAHALGHTDIAGTPYRVKMTSPSEPTPYRSVSSAEVKKADPAAWRAAQALTGFVQVKAPAAVAAAVPVEAVPEAAVADFVDPATAVLVYKEDPAWVRLRELRAVETETLGRLEKLAADAGWDGDLKVFADGWSVQLKRMQFSGEKLAAAAPEVYDRVAVTKLKVVSPHVVVGRVSPEGTADYDGE